MAIYDYEADATTATTAWLAQFTVTAEGNIRHNTGTDTFHVFWIHRSLQKIAYDFAISGDDELNLTKPDPSTSAAVGTIITLKDHTTAYGVQYNLTDAEAEYHFGGSIEQGGATVTRYSGLIVLGSVNEPTTELQIIQNGALLTSHWGTGKNQTNSSTLLRVLVKTVDAGSETDGQRVVVKANEWGDTYSVWRTELGLGEKVAAINTASDPQNTTLIGTVQGYSGIAINEGFVEIDLQEGSGVKPYMSEIDYGGNNKKAAYEWVKEQMVRGTSNVIYGLDGDLFTGGPTFKADIDSGSGTWVQNEVVSWTEDGTVSEGSLIAVDFMDGSTATEIWIHLNFGINPTDGTVLTGAGSASGTVDVSMTSLSPAANMIGLFTGNWIGEYGVGFLYAQMTKDDAVKPLDNSGPLSPPNNVSATIVVNGTTNAHVFLSPSTGGVIDETQYTVDTATNATSSFIINEVIASDTPTSGWILVKEGTTFEPVQYDSWDTKTFTTTIPLGTTYTSAKDVIIPIFYDNVSSDGGNVTTSLIQSSDIPVAGWVRQGTPTNPGKPVPISGTIGTAGYSASVTIEAE